MITQKAGRNAPEPRKARNIAVKIQSESTWLCESHVAVSGSSVTTLSVTLSGVVVEKKEGEHEVVGGDANTESNSGAGTIKPRWDHAIATPVAHQESPMSDGGVRQADDLHRTVRSGKPRREVPGCGTSAAHEAGALVLE